MISRRAVLVKKLTWFALASGLLTASALPASASGFALRESAGTIALGLNDGYVVAGFLQTTSLELQVLLSAEQGAGYQYLEHRSVNADDQVARATFETTAPGEARITIELRSPARWQRDERVGSAGALVLKSATPPRATAPSSSPVVEEPHRAIAAVSMPVASTPPIAESKPRVPSAVLSNQVALTEVTSEPTIAPDPTDDVGMENAEKAFRSNDFATAARLYERYQAIENLSDEDRALAVERGSIARELNGQLAHAVAGYRRYLKLFPDLPGAQRVAQRLNALVVDAQPQSDTPRQRDQKSRDSVAMNAHIGQFYRRQELEIAGEDSVPLDALFTDVDGLVSWNGTQVDAQLRISATHVQDFSDRAAERSDESRFRLGRVYADLEHDGWGTSVRFGRQSNYDTGASGRFDGLVIEQKVGASSTLGIAAGYLIDSSFDGVRDDRPFVSLFYQHSFYDGKLDISPYLVTQTFDGVKDREAVGVRGRWIGEQLRLQTAIDYDVHHAVLNNAFVNGTWAFTRATNVSWNMSRRRTPFLTTRNALIGQGDMELSELERDLVGLSLEDLALDRTSVNDVVGMTLSHRFNERWRLTTDATVSRLSGTEDSQGVVGFPSRQDVYVSARLLADQIFGAGTSSSMWLRHSVSDASKTTALFWDNRFNITDSLWFFPRLRYDYRVFDDSSRKETRTVPSMRLIWRYARRVRFELESGYDITNRDMETMDVDSSGLFFRLGYRASF